MSRALGMVASGADAERTWPGTKPQDWEHEADGNGPVNLGNGPTSIGNRLGNSQRERNGEQPRERASISGADYTKYDI